MKTTIQSQIRSILRPYFINKYVIERDICEKSLVELFQQEELRIKREIGTRLSKIDEENYSSRDFEQQIGDLIKELLSEK